MQKWCEFLAILRLFSKFDRKLENAMFSTLLRFKKVLIVKIYELSEQPNSQFNYQ